MCSGVNWPWHRALTSALWASRTSAAVLNPCWTAWCSGVLTSLFLSGALTLAPLASNNSIIPLLPLSAARLRGVSVDTPLPGPAPLTSAPLASSSSAAAMLPELAADCSGVYRMPAAAIGALIKSGLLRIISRILRTSSSSAEVAAAGMVKTSAAAGVLPARYSRLRPAKVVWSANSRKTRWY